MEQTNSMKQFIINWICVLTLIFGIGIIISHLYYFSQRPTPISPAEIAADKRYEDCLNDSLSLTANQGQYQSFDPSKCDGALGEYAKNSSN